MGRLDGRVALVTGASRGIGSSLARRFAAEGAAVALLARSGEELDAVVAEIRADGGTAVAVRADLTSEGDRTRAVAEAEARLGPIDVLVNNAAVTFLAPLDRFDERRFRLMVEVQLWAPLHLAQLVLPGIYERGAGWVLNVSSRSARHTEATPGIGAYGTVKAGLERLTTALAAEGRDRGLRVNALAPWHLVVTPGATAHGFGGGVSTEDVSLLCGRAVELCSGDETGLIAYTQEPPPTPR